ncbi:MAG: hypothetical protein WBL63_14175 [Candidatus Acidiferrum sp.]
MSCLNVRLDFRTETHPAITVGVGFGVDHAGSAVSFVRRSTGDFRRDPEGSLDGHTDLKRGGGYEKEATAGDVGSFREMLGLAGC